MAKQGQRAEVNTFIQGLITEASPLNFPPNASKDEENFELFRDGTRRRRLGLVVETNFTPTSTDLDPINNTDAGKNTFTWESVEGNPALEFLAVQIGTRLYFFDRSDPDTPIGSQFLDIVTTTFPVNVRYSFTAINGKLIVAAGNDSFGVVSYNAGAGTFSIAYRRLSVRDFWGVQCTVQPAYESDIYCRSDLDPQHIYNLRNQSWGLRRKNAANAFVDPINEYFTAIGLYPSDSEIVWTGLAFQPVDGVTTPYERMFNNLYDDVWGSTPSAPKGFLIIDLLARGAGRSAAIAQNYSRSVGTLLYPTYTAISDTTTGGASVVCEYAGRVWYAGFGGAVTNGDTKSPNLTNYICFSQLVKSLKEIDMCYQEGDPTSRDGSDIVDTDGGYIRLAGANRIIHMVVLARQLVVFADNGIWSISGGGDNSFTATNYEVTKVSTNGCVSASSVTEQGDQIFYWGEGGIFFISQDKFAQLIVNSVTQTTIQTLYDDIPLESKQRCYGTVDEAKKRISWLYREGEIFQEDSVTKELIMDLTLSCFYQNRIMPSSSNGSFEHFTEVVMSFYDTEIRYVALQASFSLDPGDFYFMHYAGSNFRDWYTGGDSGTDARAYLLTGSQIAGDSAIVKQTPYVVMHFQKTETETDVYGVPLNQSGCLFRYQWDWATGSQSGKFSTLQQAYRYRKPFFANLPDTSYDNGFETISTKNKVRGRGRAFALYLETEPGKDCNFLGWNLTINGNALA